VTRDWGCPTVARADNGVAILCERVHDSGFGAEVEAVARDSERGLDGAVGLERPVCLPIAVDGVDGPGATGDVDPAVRHCRCGQFQVTLEHPALLARLERVERAPPAGATGNVHPAVDNRR
jgi:hypothetical protein